MNQDIIDSITKEANSLNIEVAAIEAVFEVESAGIPFWNVNGKNLPAIRFEGHYFYARLNDKAQRDLAVKQGLASPIPGRVANPTSFSGRYELLARAKAINEQAALESTSWGLGQVMGANWKSLGYSSVNELVDAANTIDGQVDMVFRFIKTNNLVNDINTHNWTAFKNGYNGKLANGYDTKIKLAYDKYANKDDTVLQMQRMLNAVGNYKLNLDGIKGLTTKAALEDFQLKNNLTVDGIYGPITKEVLEKAYTTKQHTVTTNIGAGAAGAGTLGSGITEAANNISQFAYTSHILQYLFVGLVIIGLCITAYGVYKQFNK